MKKCRFVFLSISILIVFVIFGMSLVSGDSSSANSTAVTKLFYEIFPQTINFLSENRFDILVRKIAHFSEYLCLGVFVSLTIVSFKAKSFYKFIYVVIGLIVCLLDEFLFQGITIGRNPYFNDCIIDYSGYIVGYTVILLIFIKNYNIKQL